MWQLRNWQIWKISAGDFIPYSQINLIMRISVLNSDVISKSFFSCFCCFELIILYISVAVCIITDSMSLLEYFCKLL